VDEIVRDPDADSGEVYAYAVLPGFADMVDIVIFGIMAAG
jgi:hypothetical protein